MNITKYAVLLRSYYNIWRVFIVMNWEKKKKMQQRQVWRICITWVAGIVKWTHGSSWVQNIDKSSTFFCIVACDTYSISLSMCGVVGECWTQARTESEVNYRRISSSTVLVAPAPSTRNHILQKKKNYNEKRNIHQQATTMLSYATESCNLTRQRDIDKQTVIQVQWTGHARASSPSRTWWQKKQHSTFMQIKQHLIYISSIREKEMKFDIAKYDIFFCDIIELIVLIRKWFKPPNRAFLSLSLYLSFPFIRFTLFPLSSSRG